MDRRLLSDLLQSVAAGRLAPEEAVERLARLPITDLGFAQVDTHRALRTGLPEVIYAESKTPEQVRDIAAAMLATPGGAVLATRATQAHADACASLAPDWIPDARLLVFRRADTAPRGVVAVVAAGTSDLPVANEAAATAEALGVKVERLTDIGVAGLHRLLAAEDRLRAADVVVVVAGMEGALASAVAGLVRAPVVAVPTSVGYGASFGGLAALLGMLSSCAPGVAVVNIDNGFGAAALAARLLGDER